jgi:hypothetical protein
MSVSPESIAALSLTVKPAGKALTSTATAQNNYKVAFHFDGFLSLSFF